MTGKETNILPDEYSCNGFPIVVEDTTLPTDTKGTSHKFIYDNTYITMLNLNDVVFKVNKDWNFLLRPLTLLQGTYEAYEQNMSTKTLFYMKRRFGLVRLKLQSALVTVLDGLSDPLN